MKERMLLKKTCSIYASDLHFATVIFPFVSKQLERNTIVKTILERNEEENIEKITNNIGLNSETKDRIRGIYWNKSDITKIRKIFKQLEQDIQGNKDIVVIVLGTDIFIEKINKAIDIWVKNNISKSKNEKELNIINCFSLDENRDVSSLLNSHDYILKTSGIEVIIKEEEMLKAN